MTEPDVDRIAREFHARDEAIFEMLRAILAAIEDMRSALFEPRGISATVWPSTSDATTAAARENGKKGGRPPKANAP